MQSNTSWHHHIFHNWIYFMKITQNQKPLQHQISSLNMMRDHDLKPPWCEKFPMTSFEFNVDGRTLKYWTIFIPKPNPEMFTRTWTYLTTFKEPRVVWVNYGQQTNWESNAVISQSSRNWINRTHLQEFEIWCCMWQTSLQENRFINA